MLERDGLEPRLAELLDERDGDELMDDLERLGDDDRLGDEKVELRDGLLLGLENELDCRDELEEERDDRVENEGDRLVLLELEENDGDRLVLLELDEKEGVRLSLLDVLEEERLGEMSIVPRLLDLEEERLGEE